MSFRFRFLLTLNACLLMPAIVQAQAHEEGDTEVILPVPNTKIPPNRADLAEVAKQIIDQTNDFRSGESRVKVEVNPKLAKAAQYFAQFMARTDKYGHHADENRPADRATKHGYAYCIVSENIAYQYNSAGFGTGDLAKGFFEGWKHSPGHRKNMLDPDVTQTGVAVARSAETGHYYAVQMFGRPKSMVIEFTITNQSETEVKYQIGGRSFPLTARLIRTHQRCRPADVTFRWPGADGQARVVQPSNGDRFVVTRKNGAFHLTKE